MIKGIDISNWQAGLDLSSLDIDFAIMKATEGTDFIDAYCDSWVQQAKSKGIKYGFYHFANNNNPSAEAEFFVENTRGYFGEGIPVLDIEDDSIPNWGVYADEFTRRVYELTGVWPMIYTSAGFLSRFAGYECVDYCGLWCAGYPYAYSDWTDDEFPYNCSPWDFVAIWQFTSSLRLNGYNGDLDGDIAYMPLDAWDRYANVTSQHSEKTIADVAYEVIRGYWGNGMERKTRLIESGFDYTSVQNYVNELYSIAHKVIHGEYGNGEDRIVRLAQAGYNPEAVQYIVNDILA